MKMIRKSMIAGAVAMAFAGGVQAGSVLIDVNGSGAGPNVKGVDRYSVNLFDWVADNLLIKDVTPTINAPAETFVYAQGRLGQMQGSSGVFSYDSNAFGIVGQLTYQLKTKVAPSAGVGGNIVLDPLAGGSFFEIYYHSAVVANQVSGCGYGANQSAGCGAFAGTLILSGSALIQSSLEVRLTNTATGGLDQFDNDGNGDVDGGINTVGLGLDGFNINVDVLYQNPLFVLSNVISITTDIDPDLQHAESGTSPFRQAQPSDEVVGNTPKYGPDSLNNLGATSCGGASNGQVCDIHMQTDATTSVITTQVPEPASLALMGLGLGLLGGMGRRLARRAS